MKDSRINIAMSCDTRGIWPTLVCMSAAARHSSRPIHGRIFVRQRDAFPADMRVGDHFVEFVEVSTKTSNVRTQHLPAHCTDNCFDRWEIIHRTDWEKCILFDYDQLPLRDLAALWDLDLGENLMAARIFHLPLGEAARQWFGYRLPPKYRFAQNYKYFYMGPFCHLDAMRESDFWDKLLEFQAGFHVEDQICATVAVRGRILELEAGWNCVPHWERDMHRDDHAKAVLHFSGPEKPWNSSRSFRRELWVEEAKNCIFRLA